MELGSGDRGSRNTHMPTKKREESRWLVTHREARIYDAAITAKIQVTQG